MSSRTQAINDRGGEALNQRCGGPLEIVSQNMRCNELAFDADFLKTVQTEGMACAQQASRDAYNFTPDKVKLVTGEGQVSFGRMVEGSGKVSLHALGRALDIFSVELSKGPALMTPRMNGGEDKNFYASFRVCWEGVVRKAQGMGIAGSGGDGTVEYLDSRVHNHLHISLPALDDIRSRHGVAGS